jgi:uncharacterized membrane protein
MSQQRWRNQSGPGGNRKATAQFDILLACALALAAAFAFAFLPPGSAVRVALVTPGLFLVPGYLLIRLVADPSSSGRIRGVHALLAVGVSPALVGLLALATAFVPGGFRPVPIVATVTTACLLLGAGNVWRRPSGRDLESPTGNPEPEHAASILV